MNHLKNQILLFKYFSFLLHHPSMQKRAVIKSLMGRAAKIPTTKSDQIKEKQQVISTLQAKGHPKCFLLGGSNLKPLAKDTSSVAESLPWIGTSSCGTRRVTNQFSSIVKVGRTLANYKCSFIT